MNVRRLLIAEHPVLALAAQRLETLRAPPPPYPEVPLAALLYDIDNGPPVSNRVHAACSRRVPPIYGAISGGLPLDTRIASLNYYPPGGSGFGWHTDSTAPGHRVYLGRPADGTPGLFYAVAPGEPSIERAQPESPGISIYPDMPGTALAFTVPIFAPPVQPLPWHAVYCGGERFSLGLRIDFGSATARALGFES